MDYTTTNSALGSWIKSPESDDQHFHTTEVNVFK